MSVPERVAMVPIGREPDPLLEEIVSAEGYEVVHVPSVSQLLDTAKQAPFAGAALLLGDCTDTQVSQLMHEAARRLPQAKILLLLSNQQGTPRGCQIPANLAGRVLSIYGETGCSDAISSIRRFLRGEGYHWASDLGSLDRDASLLDATSEIKETHPEEVRKLLRFAADLSKFTDLRAMLQEALKRYLEIIACDAGSIYLWDEDSDTLVLEAALGPELDRRVGLRQKLGEGLAGWVAEVGESIFVTDTRKVSKLKGRTCRRYNDFSCIAVPITHGGQLFGVICLTMPRNERTFQPHDLQIAQILAQKLAGVIRPLSVLSELRRFSERLMGAFQTSSDIVQEKDAQVESLRALQGNILDNMPLAVISYDPDLRIRSANRLARHLFGFEAESNGSDQGIPLQRGLSIDAKVWSKKLRSVIRESNEARLQRIPYRNGDDEYILDIVCSPLRDGSGECLGGIITAMDVSADVEMEAKLSSAERLALVGKLAAKVAHELNNPLDGILRFLNLAIRQIDNPAAAQEYLEESRTGLLRMSNILSELLTFSRSQRRGDEPATLTQVVRQSLSQYAHRAQETNVTIQADVPPDLPLCPSNDVWEVFANVVKNGLDSMKECNEGVLKVTARNHGAEVRIHVADTGPGVPESLHDKIFEPFFTTKKAGLGTGLGLALCRDSLRRIGGDIKLLPSESGATFEIIIPIKANKE